MTDERPRVFLAGPDRANWAFDENIRLTVLSLAGIADVVPSVEDAEIIHSMWWGGVTAIPSFRLRGKRVVVYTNDDPYLRILGDPGHLAARSLVALWLARNHRERAEYDVLGMRSAYVPRIIDLSIFRPVGKDDPAVRALRSKWGLPDGRYLIGNFQRDTLLEDLTSPKLKKGPDIFAEIVHALHRRGLPIHVVLAGPRRSWIRQRLRALGVPYTYVGKEVDGDDIAVNTQPRDVLNTLYNAIDLTVVSSRDEGHPAAVTESAAAGCRIISTRVGIAPDLLEAECLYRSVAEAVTRIADDVDGGVLAATVDVHRRRVLERHDPRVVGPILGVIYRGLRDLPGLDLADGATVRLRARGSRVVRAVRRVLGAGRRGPSPVVSFWNVFYPPPYGGANQFLRALGAALAERGLTVVENRVHGADVHILQGYGFDVARFRRHFRRLPLRVIHRLDGPVHLYRGFDRDKDELVFELNRECATATVVQSAWSLERTVEMGYQPVNPVLIPNAPDPRLFHRNGRAPFSRERRLRLISTAWSDNPRKGGDIYRYLDAHIDRARFEYTFVGRTQEAFRNIRFVPPVATEELAGYLRAHDVYVMASRVECCSNALGEALACGLPALYSDSSSNPEQVGFGGVGFRDEHDVLDALDRLARDYETYAALVAPIKMAEVADRYSGLIQQVLTGDWVGRPPTDCVSATSHP